MSTVWLAARLARAGGLARVVLTGAGCGLACVVLLVLVSLPGAASGQLDALEARLVGLGLLLLALPVVMLVVTTTRLSASTRDRQLGALRVLGVSADRTRTVAALEAGALAAGGVGAAAVVVVVAGPALGAAAAATGGWADGEPLRPPGWGWVACTAGLLVLVTAVAAVPAGRVLSAPLVAVSRSAAPPPAWWRLAPVVVGLALLGALAATGGPPATHDGGVDGATGGGPGGAPAGDDLVVMAAGLVLTGLGVPVALPVLVRVVADVAVRWAPSPSVLLAGRRLQHSPTASTRIVAALLVGAFVVLGARGVQTAFEQAPSVLRYQHATADGPASLAVDLTPGQSLPAGALSQVAGVRAVAPVLQAPVACTPGQAEALPGRSTADGCATAVVASCPDLQTLRLAVAECVPGQAAWLRAVQAVEPPHPADQPVTLLVQPATAGASTAGVDLPPVTVERQQVLDPQDPAWNLYDDRDVLLLPPSAALLAAVGPPTSWMVTTDGGPAGDRARQEIQALGAAAAPMDSPDGVRALSEVTALVRTAAVLVLGVGLLALLLVVVDSSLARRREVGPLLVAGVPLRVTRTAQVLQTAAALWLGLALVAPAALLAATSYLSTVGVLDTAPWPAGHALTANAAPVARWTLVGLLAALAVATTTLLGLGRRPRLGDLRRE